ncbi:helix-turn-helix transcriptional regulator [Labedaea rhizosphaerae]|uniref:AraC-like DNA-binding protein n=1 Tax=Labedaea rhizosphaerae TaxID=598644 RepID=A0A4R6RSV8_LABRH|nr:AraC family transcriptional regulator [Labedaea rhizosphaerae]TDP89902.1 AraC-like DNA-binding protein [Labedaea rhizosphaerae]
MTSRGAGIPYSEVIDLEQSPERTIVELPGLGALGGYRYLHAHAPRPPSRHRTLLVLAMPVRGAFSFDLDGDVHEVRPGRLIRIPPGRTYTTGLAAEPRGALIWLIARVLTGPDTTARALRLLAEPAGALIADAEQVSAPLQQALTLATAERDWIGDALLSHAVATGVLAAARAFTSGDRSPSWPHQRVARVLAWIEEHVDEPITAADLAAVAGLSTTRFYDAFRAATGTSPKDHLLRRKTELARDWLRRDPAVKVTTVAHALGFSTPQRFATVFRRYQGVSPSACREP